MHQFSPITITVVLLYFKVFIRVFVAKPIQCDIMTDDQKQCFIKDMLLSADHNANQMAVDKNSNTLYFSFDAGQGEFNPAMLSIETKKLKLLKGVKDAYAIASNDSNGDVYFGGSNGIYKYVPAERKLMRLQFKDLDVWWLFIKKDIFYIQFPKLTAYRYVKKTIKPVKAIETNIVHQFVYDFQSTIFFINASGVFRVKQKDDRPIMVRTTRTFLGLAVDNRGKVHMCSDDGIYVVNNSVRTEVTRLVGVRGVLSMAFDKSNHLIYSDAHDLVRLLPMQKREINTAKVKPSDFKSVFVCHKSCEVLKMRVVN